MYAGDVRRGEIRARSAQWLPRMSLRLLTAVEGGEKGADLAGDLGDDLGLAAPVGGAGVAGGAVVQAGKLHAPAARERPGQRVAGRLEEGQPFAPAQDEDVGGDRPECVDGAGHLGDEHA